MYLILFMMGGILALLEETAKNSDSVFNKKILGFLPAKHFFTVAAVVVCIISLIVYCVNAANRTASLVLCAVGIILLAAVAAIDAFIIFKKAKHR